MTITYVNAGTLFTGTIAVTGTYPAGIVANDLLVLEIVSGHPSESTPTTPAGWELIGSLSGGGGAYGSGTGPRRLTMYTRQHVVGSSAPVITIPTGTGATIGGRMIALHSSVGLGWRWSLTMADMTVASTSFAVTGADVTTYATNDFVVLGYAIRSNAPTLSAEAITASPDTFGTITEQADDSIATGNLARLSIATGLCTAGSTSQVNPRISATLSASHTGVAGALRVREASVTNVATVQNADPPRVQVALNGLLAEEISVVSIDRVVGNLVENLRGAVIINVAGQNAFVRVDGEMPFGQLISYRATLVDSLGNTWISMSNTVTVTTIAHEIISDATLGFGVDCQIMNWHERRYVRESTQFNVSGRIIVVSGPQPAPSSTITLFTQTTADRNAMLVLLAQCTNGILQIRTHATQICMTDPDYDSHAQVDSYLQIISTVLERAAKFRYPQRIWELEVVEAEPWPLTIEARGYTLADINAYYPGQSLQAIATQFTPGTLLDIAIFDWAV